MQACVVALAGVAIASCAAAPPREQDDVCQVFSERPSWYDDAKASEARWGTPIQVLMAFVKQESAYRHDAKPPRRWWLFIPLPRRSSAEGYAQIQDAAWRDYKEEVGGFLKSRRDMADAVDFIGWYNHKSHRRLGVAKSDARRLYLAYHEGHRGYERGSYRNKPKLLGIAKRVARQADRYAAQLRACERKFQCRKWYQAWPWCRKT